MFKFAALNRDYIFLNISEVRQQLAELINRVKKYKVVVMRNGKPAMMIVDFDEYQRFQEMLEAEENEYFANAAKERLSEKAQKTYSHEEVVKKFKK